jgi:FMN phosphatase YigB (HAD superfamily)
VKKIEHLLVDLDGTLVGSTEYRVRLEFVCRFIYWWRKHEKPWKLISALRQMGKALESAPGSLTNDVKAVRAFASALSLEEQRASELLKDCIEEIFPKLQNYFFPIPGASDFVGWARSIYPLTLATNPVWSPEVVELRVKWAGLEMDLFQSFTHVQRMSACKPRIEYYKELLSQEKLDPEKCLLIGDDMQNDAPAARTGIRVFILSHQNQATRMTRGISGQASLWCGNYTALKKALQEGVLETSL